MHIKRQMIHFCGFFMRCYLHCEEEEKPIIDLSPFNAHTQYIITREAKQQHPHVQIKQS